MEGINLLKLKNLFFIFMAFVIVLSACTNDQSTANNSETKGEEEKATQVTGDKTLNVAIPGDPKNLDPHFAGSLAQYAVVQNVFNGLVRLPPGSVDVNKIEGDLAESWEKNNEATEWTFHLREGIQWHKGYGEFTSEDVKLSFERILDPANGITSRNKYASLKQIDVPDKYTVVFHLSAPDPLFLTKVLAYSGGFIINKKAIDSNEVIGTGPFVVEEHKTQDSVITVKNKEFFRGEPKIDKVIYKVMTDPTAVNMAMEKGEIHMAHGTSDALWIADRKTKADLVLEYTGPMAIGNLYLNVSKPPLDNIKVRQAIAYAIDAKSYAESMVDAETGNVPLGPIPSEINGVNDSDRYEYNIEKAKQLLKEAGYENGLTLPKQYTSTQPYASKPMLYAQDQLKKVGIDMPLETVDDTTYTQNVRKGLNNITYIAFTRVPHISVWINDVFYGPSAVGTPTGNINFSHYSKSDELIKQALVETDEAKANQLYQEIQQQIKDEYAAVPLVEYTVPEIRRKEVDLGYKQEGNLLYYFNITELTDLK